MMHYCKGIDEEGCEFEAHGYTAFDEGLCDQCWEKEQKAVDPNNHN